MSALLKGLVKKATLDRSSSREIEVRCAHHEAGPRGLGSGCCHIRGSGSECLGGPFALLMGRDGSDFLDVFDTFC